MQIAPALIAFSLDFFDASSICISSFSAHELALLQISSETISNNDLKRVNGKLLLANPQSQRIEIEHYLNTQLRFEDPVSTEAERRRDLESGWRKMDLEEWVRRMEKEEADVAEIGSGERGYGGVADGADEGGGDGGHDQNCLLIRGDVGD
ncbi:hypothetical protein SASPL_144442 [Salvia splendens]|uniref:Uncharacterized protein n=1 Tax=Salvia splendens TaxID=180675 RepID=A0A8X8Z758_SALSN|nr:hypothetical protein SASPL_144442 [Salvia splendens]